MKLTSKHKYGNLVKFAPLLAVSDVDILEEILKLYPYKKNNEGADVIESPFVEVGGYKVKNGFDLSFEDLVEFWQPKDETALVKHVAKSYLEIESDKQIMKLPLFEFLRLVIYAKDMAILAADQFKSLKRQYSTEEIAAGIEEMESDDFDVVDRFCIRNGIVDRDEGYRTAWPIIFRCFKIDFQNNRFQEKYSEVVKNMSK